LNGAKLYLTERIAPGNPAVGSGQERGASCGRLRFAVASMPLIVLTSSVAQVASQPALTSTPALAEPLSNLARMLSALTVIAVEIAAVALLCAALYGLLIALLRTAPGTPARQAWRGIVRLKARRILVALGLAMAAGVLCVNGFWFVRGADVQRHTLELVRSLGAGTSPITAAALTRLALAILAVIVAIRVARGLLRAAEQWLTRWEQLGDDNRSLATLFVGLEGAVVNIGWILVVLYACILFAVPGRITSTLLLGVRIYVVVAIGLIVIRSTATIVDTLDGLGRRYAQSRNWQRHYDHLRALLPTLRACLEYALWVGVASLVLVQVSLMQGLAAWGPRLIQAIAIFFAGRVVIELGRLELVHRMLPREGLEETERRRRATMIPLVRSVFTYAVYFATAVLVLGSLGFNPMPFLAGAGLAGLVIGFGSQSLINDVVSGFFILFENIYLVGDIVEVGQARGVVEAIEFRTTTIRDADGRVHIIRNGDMKPVINYSKDYAMAIVAVEVPYDADLQRVFAALRQASERLRVESRDVLNDTEIDGITAFGASSMTIRTSTRVRPGQHESTAAALRLLINETFDRQVNGGSRKTLIGDMYAKHAAAHGG
jgi:moderate conductance mechanosensitive channel